MLVTATSSSMTWVAFGTMALFGTHATPLIKAPGSGGSGAIVNQENNPSFLDSVSAYVASRLVPSTKPTRLFHDVVCPGCMTRLQRSMADPTGSVWGQALEVPRRYLPSITLSVRPTPAVSRSERLKLRLSGPAKQRSRMASRELMPTRVPLAMAWKGSSGQKISISVWLGTIWKAVAPWF